MIGLIMKAFWSVLAKILFVLVLVQTWFLYDFYSKSQVLIVNNVQLEQQLSVANKALANVNEALATANKKIVTLEVSSLDSVLKETNKAVINSWQALLNTVEGELNKARESIDSTIDDLRQELPVDGKKQETPVIIDGERT
jgi:cell shape-determining protein MreC